MDPHKVNTMITNKKRSNLECKLSILRNTQRFSLPTQIMYASYMSWNAFNEDLEALTRLGLIRMTPNPAQHNRDKRVRFTYALTNDGEKVLEYAKELIRLLDLKLTFEDLIEEKTS